MKNSSFIKITLGIIFVGLVIIAATVAVIDPFFHYHGPIKGFPYQIDNQLSQNPGMARNMDYDSIMLGSSMTVNFEGDLFMEKHGQNLLKLSYNGAYPRDIKNITDQVYKKQLREGRPFLKTVYLGIDLASYSGDTDEIKYPIPEYLYDDDPFNDIKYLLNKDVLLDYCLKPVVEWEPTNMSDVYSSEQDLSGCYSKEYVLSHYSIPEKIDAWFPEDMFIEKLSGNLEENILPVIRRNQETEFVVFFPPYSILYWYEYICYNQMDAVLYSYEYIIDRLLEWDNVKVYFFPDEERIVTDLDIYADTGHYRRDINRYMTECFKTGEHRVTRDNYKTVLKNFAEIIYNYDYENLLKDKSADDN